MERSGQEWIGEERRGEVLFRKNNRVMYMAKNAAEVVSALIVEARDYDEYTPGSDEGRNTYLKAIAIILFELNKKKLKKIIVK